LPGVIAGRAPASYAALSIESSDEGEHANDRSIDHRDALLAAVALTAVVVAQRVDAQCAGDCNDDGEVSINDLIAVVNVSLVRCR
jgi:hypothetical protein